MLYEVITANPDQSDLDGDGIGDVADKDADNDGVPDSVDNAMYIANPDQSDIDRDGIGDVADNDADNDGVADDTDNAPYVYNPDQLDTRITSYNVCYTKLLRSKLEVSSGMLSSKDI